jgi:putative PIN family toxin of toxin-antitoxin system
VRVVLDANVVFAGAGWRGEAHGCLVMMARRRITVFATPQILEELRALVAERGYRSKHSPHSLFGWYYSAVKVVEPAPLGKQRSRDPNDDPYLACALAARARLIVTRDEDLLAMKKPFGIEIITPRELLTRLARPGALSG